MTDWSLLLNNQPFSLSDLQKGGTIGNTEFEQSTLAFCRQWLNDAKTFSLQTSGSTGEPKTIEVKRKQMEASAHATLEYFNLTPGDTAMVCLSTTYIAGKMMLARGLEGGLKLICNEPTSHPLEQVDLPIDFLAVVPLQLEHILANPASLAKLQAIKSVIVGGAPVSYALSKQILDSGANVYATFGMTETMTHIGLQQLSPEAETYFTTLDHIQIANDHRGCLVITGPQTNNEPIVTNDLVEIIDDQQFRWVGRADNIVNSGGYKIQLEKVEHQIAECFYELGLQNRYFAYGVEDEHLGSKLRLLIEGCDFSKKSLKKSLKSHLDKYERPKKIKCLSHFMETPTGKIDRQATLTRLKLG